jgi:hypothetical protein
MQLAEFVKQAEGRLIRNERGRLEPLRLLSPASEEQVRKLEQGLPNPLPEEIRELLRLTRGFENGPYEVSFSGFVLEDLPVFGVVSEFFKILPYQLSIATDGCGNDWMVDVATNEPTWGPVYFACHDPPVFVFTASNLREFIEEWLKLAEGTDSKLGRSFDQAVMRVWKENPGLIPHETAIQSSDPHIKAFAEKVGDGFQFVDLRQATVGDGFSLNRMEDPDADFIRDVDNLLFAIRKPQPRKRFLQRLFGR